MRTDAEDRPSTLARLVPILGWLPGYDRSWLRVDLIAGVTVVALLVPEGMAYAQLAGVPPETAFYAAPAGLVLYAIFGTSRQLVVAVSSAVAITSASIVGMRTDTGSAEFIALTAALALVVGLVMVVAGLLRFGQISQFFSESVLTGFVFGLALVIAAKQLPKVFGVEGAAEGNFFVRLVEFLSELPEAHRQTVLVGVTTLVLMLVFERFFDRIPAALAALVYGIGVSAIFGLEDSGVEVVGDIPGGLAGPAVPDIAASDVTLLIVGGLGLGLLAFAEAIGPARQFASKHGYQVDPNQEMLAIGAANASAGLFQGFPIGASLSKSAANDRAGARTPLSLIVAALLTVLVALFFTDVFAPLPEATLGAIVIVAVSGMANVGEMRRLRRLNTVDFALALIALVCVLFFEALLALGIAVVLSLLLLVVRVSRANISELGRLGTGGGFGDVTRHAEHRKVNGLLVVRPNAELFFANVEGIRSAIVAAAREADPPTKAVLLDLEMTYEIDVPTADVLGEVIDELEGMDVGLMLARVHGKARDMLESTGVLERLGPDGVHDRLVGGVMAYLGTEGAGQAEAEVISESLRDAISSLERVEGEPDDLLIALRDRLQELEAMLGP